MTNTASILVIDDDPLIHTIIAKSLASHYQLHDALDGEQGIALANDLHPDFILLDVEMPGMNGYSVCHQLKQNDHTQDIPVLFLPGHSGLRERMQGYDAGAADFIVKPFEGEELKAKLKSLGQFKDTREQLAVQAKQATETAFTAMRGSSELGMAIQFIESSYNAADFPILAEHFFEVTHALGLNCSLLFNTYSGSIFFNPKGSVSPLEQEVMATLFRSPRRFNDFGSRTQINYPRVALLVKNMPLDDPEAYGRYKDFLPTMLGSTDAKIKSLDAERALQEQTQNLTNSFVVVRKTLTQLGEMLQSTQKDVLNLLQNMISELEVKIPTMGLDEDQEKYLITTLDQAIVSTHAIMDTGNSAQSAFNNVGRLLDHLAEKQQQLLSAVVNTPQQKATEPEHAISATGEVELF